MLSANAGISYVRRIRLGNLIGDSTTLVEEIKDAEHEAFLTTGSSKAKYMQAEDKDQVM